MPYTIVIDLHDKRTVFPTVIEPQNGGGKKHSVSWSHYDQSAPQIIFPQKSRDLKCKPKQNIAFIKTYKAGGSTVTNILSRFAIKHDLNIHGRLRCGNKHLHDFHCDISNATTNLISEHISYDREFLSSIMAEDTIYVMAPSHQKYFSSDGHRMAIRQNGFLYNTIQHSHTSDAERMEIRFRGD